MFVPEPFVRTRAVLSNLSKVFERLPGSSHGGAGALVSLLFVFNFVDGEPAEPAHVRRRERYPAAVRLRRAVPKPPVGASQRRRRLRGRDATATALKLQTRLPGRVLGAGSDFARFARRVEASLGGGGLRRFARHRRLELQFLERLATREESPDVKRGDAHLAIAETIRE